ncbi:MAG: FAD-dependent oxidoreductase [Alphaproteobacteria bacterium]|nr:FAD-dependent oxidoreductase [Alphaproteobacteria bacterium]
MEQASPEEVDHYDAVVVGAGFGGMGAALALAEAGARVALCEALAYPGGCASTFEKTVATDAGPARYRFEAGATLFSGFGPGQLMAQLVDRHGLDVQIDLLDPLVQLRTPTLSLDTPADRGALLRTFQALPGAPVDALARFFALQQRTADTLWALFDDEALLPPLSAAAVGTHLQRSPRYLPLVGLVGRPLARIVARHGLADFAPLRTWLDAVCQITLQTDSASVDAAFALGAMDYFFRGTGHVRGGIGVLADALCGAIERAGGTVLLAHRVRRVARDGTGWRVDARGRTLHADVLVCNQLPQDARALAGLAPGDAPALDRLARRVEGGWGACMLYLAVDGTDLPEHAHHLELVDDPDAAFVEGNHVFASVSDARETGRAPPGQRTVTVSTHLSAEVLRATPDAERGARVAAVQDRMRATLARLAPELWQARRVELPASPRTFARFTRRSLGLVGGPPRVAGADAVTALLQHDLWPAPAAPGLYLVGDSVFPGQSTLATTLGGRRTAAAILGRRGPGRLSVA